MRDTVTARRKGRLPTISDYADALANPRGRFRTLGEVEPQIDARGDVIFFAGNNAAVFPVSTAHGPATLKCYIKNGLHAKEIYSRLAGSHDPLLATARRLEYEIFVYDALGSGSWYDAVVADGWTA